MTGRVYKLYSRNGVLAELGKLRQRETLLDAAEQIAHIGHCEWDFAQDRIVSCSDGYARIFNLSVAQVLEAHSCWERVLEQIHPEDREAYIQSYESQQNNGVHEIEYRMLRHDGELRHIHETGTVEFDADGKPSAAFGLLQDITERKNYQQELENREEMANQAEAITDIGHFIFDETTESYSYISPGFARILGVDAEEYKSMVNSMEEDLEDLHPDDFERVLEVYRKHHEQGGDYNIEYRIYRGDGALRWLREQNLTLQNAEGESIQSIGVLQDITDYKQTEQSLREARDSLEHKVRHRTRKLAETVNRLEEEIAEKERIAAELDFLANHDALTGLPSLRLCKDRLEHSLAEARRNRQLSAVMFLDLDGFKEVNDAHGHELGDSVLKTTAERIKSGIRETDTVARIGGDEFIIILSSLPEVEIADRISNSLIRDLAKPIRIDEIVVEVSASIGIALYPQDGTTAEELIRAADRAMYRIKDEGKNNFGFATALGVN